MRSWLHPVVRFQGSPGGAHGYVILVEFGLDLHGSSCSKARAGACDHLKGLAVSEGLAEWLVSAATGGAVAQASAGTWIGSYVLRQSGIYW